MSGSGSGRWGTSKPDAKTLADRCLALDIKLLVRAGVIRPDVDHRGTWEWRDEPEDEEPSATIGFTARTGPDGGSLGLRYSVQVRRAGGEGVPERVDQEVRLVTTSLPTGGRRWWFQCPARRADHSVPCRRRVGKLFLPGGGRVFACRHCYELAYESSRNSTRGSRMWDELGAVAGIPGWVARRLLDNGWRKERRSKAEAGQKAVFRE
jgi:hypothetical protein